MIYTILFGIGVLGILVLALLGAGHGGHDGMHHVGELHAHHGGDLHAGHGEGGAHMGHDGAMSPGGHHSGPNHHSGPDHHHDGEGRSSTSLWSLLSPLSLFSICLGAGATGLLLRHTGLSGTALAFAAAVGAAIFYGGIIRPLWGLIFRFASKPAEMLDATVARTAEVVTPFDPTGHGIVRVEVDGQLVRVLATLEADDREDRMEFRPGDEVTITSIDGKSNTCRVTRLA